MLIVSVQVLQENHRRLGKHLQLCQGGIIGVTALQLMVAKKMKIEYTLHICNVEFDDVQHIISLYF